MGYEHCEGIWLGARDAALQQETRGEDKEMANEALRWEHLRDVFNDFGAELVAQYIANLDQRNIHATRDLANSVHYTVVVDERCIAVDISLLEYWKYIEYGRRAGKFPPLKSIEEWIKVKGIQPMTRTQSSVKRWTQHRGRIRRNDGRIPSIKSLAFLIGRKIKEEGIQPRPILATAIDDTYRRFEAAIIDAMTQDITQELNIVLKYDFFEIV